ncbi:MAG: glutamine synthetase beta-grasp domain-containing protein [Pseudomonadota bacterium]|nr:glutamine synthetase beta-grasp domain-containing protein [Pseudomonadota bacterium]
MHFAKVEYIWLDGGKTQEPRSKTKIIATETELTLKDLDQWSFDGSSTLQAEGTDSDCLLEPVCMVEDPIRGPGNYLALCEVLNPDGTPHATNQRARLRALMDMGGDAQDAWVGFEQEYTLYKGGRPLGWPENGYPAPQGQYYCGVGSDNVFGRELAEDHMVACMEAGLCFYGINAEVMPGQWEFQIGYRGVDSESADPLTMSDHLWLGRWMLYRLAELEGVVVTFDNKPEKGEWNGAGLHTNYSTKDMRDPKKGWKTIETACEALKKRHKLHTDHYGEGLAERLIGALETSSMTKFNWGTANRTTSIRIPRPVATKGYGYMEDRRPGANADPYTISNRLLETTVMGFEGKETIETWIKNGKVTLKAPGEGKVKLKVA